MALCVAVLIASEFMPVSLLSPIAVDLSITEGRTGQAISISGAFAVVTSLLVAGLTRRIDRKLVVTGLTVLLIVSGLATTFAPNFAFLMVGRALLGVAIGGFWSMSTSIVMRLVSEDRVPKGLAMLNAGNAIAATIAAPLGSFLGAYVGWRGAFFLVVPLGPLALVWQWISLPPLPPRGRRASGNVLALLGRRPVAFGMASILFLFMGQFALFTYLRPFLESVTGVGIFSRDEDLRIWNAFRRLHQPNTHHRGWRLFQPDPRRLAPSNATWPRGRGMRQVDQDRGGRPRIVRSRRHR